VSSFWGPLHAKYASFPEDIIAEWPQALKKQRESEAFDNASRKARERIWKEEYEIKSGK
jgi:hypothetical protein